uniref:Uncharacterized protein n=1 Tax=Globodera rostochiensis TaxID=31243 RepID=A0A914IEK4_GLORO
MFTNNGNMFVSTAYMIEHRGVREEACTFVVRRCENPEYFEARLVKKTGTVCVGLAPKNMPRTATIGWNPGTFGVESSGELFYDGSMDEKISNFIEGDAYQQYSRAGPWSQRSPFGAPEIKLKFT